jgi:hypothetical protein
MPLRLLAPIVFLVVAIAAAVWVTLQPVRRPVSVGWDASSDTSHYVVAAFASEGKVVDERAVTMKRVEAPATRTTVLLPDGTWRIGVKACLASRCSAYTMIDVRVPVPRKQRP